MKHFLTDWLSTPWAITLGWTLLHSLWQSLLAYGLIRMVLRYIPLSQSKARYAVALGGLVVTVLISGITFSYLYSETPANTTAGTWLSTYASSSVTPAAGESEAIIANGISKFENILESLMPLFVAIWFAGALLFTLRIAGSWWYINKLQRQAERITDGWSDALKTLAQSMGIQRMIQLAVSAKIQVPMVIGYVKPVVLLPAGLLSGLTTDQVEAILIHELTHIRRHDYIVNLFQSLMEAIYFFNPFAWMLSGMIRTEREHCCDDTVVSMHGNPLAYAKALAHLESARIARPGMALALAQNKHELLTRIKRLMEKSVTQYPGKERIVPIVLLLVGVICASWLTINPASTEAMAQQKDKSIVPQDTVKKKSPSANYSKKRVIIYDEEGIPHEKIVEEYDGDEDLFPLVSEPDENFGFDFETMVPPIPDIDFIEMMPPMADMDFESMVPPIADIDFVPSMDFNLFDTVRKAHQPANWDQFGKEFEERFKKQFGDFYKEHQQEFEKMMLDIEQQVNKATVEQMRVEEMRMAAEGMKHHADQMKRDYEMIARKQAAELQLAKLYQDGELAKQTQEAMAQQRIAMRDMEEQMVRLKENEFTMRDVQEKMKALEERMHAFQSEVNDMLIQDGYLKKGEKIKNLNWNDQDELQINDFKIKEKDKQKYMDLKKKYFKGNGQFRIVE